MRIAIAEDAALLREGLSGLLASRGHDVVAAVADADALREAVAEHAPDVAVVDIRMPPTHTDEGLRAVLELRDSYPGVGYLLFSQYIETRYASQLLAGSMSGIGYLLKERVVDIDEFTDALARVAGGGTALDPEVVTQLFGASRHRDRVTGLSPRERDVLELMAQGRTNKAIAANLVVTERAVEKHISSIFAKLNLQPSGEDHRRVLAVVHYLNS
jgi:DNA-binding NarL/FixJ family response regulator